MVVPTMAIMSGGKYSIHPGLLVQMAESAEPRQPISLGDKTQKLINYFLCLVTAL